MPQRVHLTFPTHFAIVAAQESGLAGDWGRATLSPKPICQKGSSKGVGSLLDSYSMKSSPA
jgi:hypothetical protein